jgi:hypothetical protein
VSVSCRPTCDTPGLLLEATPASGKRHLQWWTARHVSHPEFGTKTIRHPELGDLTLDWDAFAYTGDPDQQLVLWSAEPGSSSHDKLRILSSWTAPVTAHGKSVPNR